MLLQRSDENYECGMDKISSALKSTDALIRRLYDEIPKSTLLVITSGTGNSIEVSRLLQKQSLYKTHIKQNSFESWPSHRVWNEKDEEEIIVHVEKARTGISFLAVK